MQKLYYVIPAGISLPMITFSFKPTSGSIFPLIAASVRTFVVSWKDAAERNELVARAYDEDDVEDDLSDMEEMEEDAVEIIE